MIERIAELNRVLLILRALDEENNGIERNVVIRECQSIAIDGRMPDHEESIQFAIEIGFLDHRESRIALSEQGLIFVGFNPGELYDLAEQQKKYLVRSCFFDGFYQKGTKNCLKCFEYSEAKGTFTWSVVDGRPFGEYYFLIPMLEQIGVIWRRSKNLLVKKEYAMAVAEFIGESKGWTEEQFFDYMKEKKELGDLAEEIVWRWEVQRLKNAGHIVEAHCVKRISKQNVSAGYDIKSYDGKSIGMRFDRFIEVKGSKGPGIRFFWSENEMKIAQELKEQYWIYYQGGVRVASKTALYEPILYQNPVTSLSDDNRLSIRGNGVIVEGKVAAKKKIV